MTPIPEQMDDKILAGTDHDLLIRLHERIISLQSQLQTYMLANQDYGKRIDALEQFKASYAGTQSVNLRNNTILTTVLSGVIVGVLVYFFTHTN